MDRGSDTNGRHAIRLVIPAKAEYVSLCRLALSGLARVRPLSPEALADLKLAITEAASNSVRHAYDGADGTVEIRYEVGDDRLVIDVFDDGEGFELREREAEDELSEGGLGIAIIRAVADEFELSSGHDGRGSRLRFVKLLA